MERCISIEKKSARHPSYPMEAPVGAYRKGAGRHLSRRLYLAFNGPDVNPFAEDFSPRDGKASLWISAVSRSIRGALAIL
jgi:hypothetical protein